MQNSHHNTDHGRVRPPLREHVLAEFLDRLRRSPVADDGNAGLHVPEGWDKVETLRTHVQRNFTEMGSEKITEK